MVARTPRFPLLNLPLARKKMKTKLGQMKIQQMAFMLIAVVIFFVLVGLFIVVFRYSSVEESAGILEEKNALLLVTKLAESPEFACERSFGSGMVSCVDTDKVMMLREIIDDYEDFWGVTNVEVRKTYPASDEDVYCTLDNYPNCNIIRLRDEELEGTGIANYVSVCRKSSMGGAPIDKCEIGKIIVLYETQ